MDHCRIPRLEADSELDTLFPEAEFHRMRRALHQCPQYRPSPLLSLTDNGAGQVYLKDERARLGLGSFKALGGAWAVIAALCDVAERAGIPQMAEDRLPSAEELLRLPEIVCASAGNHGQAVAAGARLLGLRCRVILPATTEAVRVQAIEARGAWVERVAGDYDAAVTRAAELAEQPEVIGIPDTDVRGHTATVARVMSGYGVILEEALSQFRAHEQATPTHLFVQAGVGGLAGGLALRAARELGQRRPRVVVVEPEGAAGLMNSFRHRVASRTPGTLDSRLVGLDCAQASPLAFRVLSCFADDCLTISDREADQAAIHLQHRAGLHTSPTGAAGYAGLQRALEDPTLARRLGLDNEAVILCVLTEANV